MAHRLLPRVRPTTWTLALAMAVAMIVGSCSVRNPLDESDMARAAPTATPVPDSAAIYERVSQSIVFLESPDLTTGSGIVIEGGWILTNAHVMDRQPTVRVGRSDGVDAGDFPVAAIDWTMDLALIGPIDDPALIPMPRVESSGLAIGDRVLLLGFPDESSIDPTPTLTEGIISRRRRPALGDFPFVQVDATIAPGQSGGALIDSSGNLLGISGLEFGQGEFGLALEADAMWLRIDAMIEASAAEPEVFEIVDQISDEIGQRRTTGFLVETGDLGQIEINASSPSDIFVELRTLGGVAVTTPNEAPDVFDFRAEDTVYYYDTLLEGGEDVSAFLEPGTYQVIIGSFAATSTSVEVESSNVLRRFADIEEQAELPVGEIVEGQFDWARDSDRWTLELKAGDNVVIVVDGIADTLLAARLNGEVIAASDDEGLGLFGTGSRVEFTADVDGTYEIEVGTYDPTRWGYLIEVTVS